MLLRNIHIIGKDEAATDIQVQGEKITGIAKHQVAEGGINLNGFIAFPGLINAHDHLEFNLFPPLGSKYADYTEWGRDIHKRHKDEIDEVLRIPKLLRTKWGVLKNVLNGVTTVADHSTPHSQLKSRYINSFIGFSYLHSVALEKYWQLKLNNPWTRRSVMVHVGEGVNKKAGDEIDALIHYNFLRKKLIGIHGIAMTEDQARHFKALVWCPESNFFLYDKTAAIDRVKKHTKVLFGTDSTLSASANLWEHLRLARSQHMLTDQELFDALGTTAASVLGMPNIGAISEGNMADLVIAKRKHEDQWESFYNLDPLDIMMVVKAGRIIYYDEEMQNQLKDLTTADFAPVQLGQCRKCLLKEMVVVIEALEEFNISLPLGVKSLASHG